MCVSVFVSSIIFYIGLVANLWVGLGQVAQLRMACCVSRISHLVASKWQRLTESAFCLPTFHPLLPPRHSGGWHPGKFNPSFQM